jgi:hypothetical protein
MRASINIVEGFFCGADIEPGTFHMDGSFGSCSTCSCPESDLTMRRDRQAHASDRVPVPQDGADQALEVPERDSRLLDLPSALFHSF